MKSPVPIAPAAQSSVAEQKRGFAILDSERWLGPLLIGPAVIYIFLLVGVPFFMALYYSVSNTTTGGGTMGFVGLRNFTAVIGTPKFQTALKNTIVFGLISQAVILVLSNALALALQHEFPGRRLIRFLILLPWVAPISIGTIAWLWIFDSTYSVLNWMLRLAGLIHGPGYMWLGLPNLAMGSIIAVHVWRQLPLATVILLAGYGSIPQDIHDAAAVDDGDSVTGPFDLVEQVGGQHDGAALGHQRQDHVADPGYPGGVESVHRLVQNEQLRVSQQAGGDAQTLAHAHGVLRDPVVGAVG